MQVLRRDLESTGRPALFVATEGLERIDSHFTDFWPEARVISDPEKRLYAAFGLKRGNLMQFAGPKVWMATLRAFGRGAGLGRPSGDPLMMSGYFLVEADGRVAWEHVSRHAGDVDVVGDIPKITGQPA